MAKEISHIKQGYIDIDKRKKYQKDYYRCHRIAIAILKERHKDEFKDILSFVLQGEKVSLNNINKPSNLTK